MNSQNWNAEEYNVNAAFVAQLGNSVVPKLSIKFIIFIGGLAREDFKFFLFFSY